MMPDEILVVFSDQTDLWWLKFLRRGFRHCFVLIRFADIWVSYDVLAHKTEMMRIDVPDTFSIVQWLENQGERVIPCPRQTTGHKVLYPSIFTCVESVKRITGLQRPFILTPWQLYKFITSLNEKEYNHGKPYITP